MNETTMAAFARPFAIYACGAAIAFAVVWAVMFAHDLAIITVPAAVTIAGGASALRSWDKKTAATAAVAAGVDPNVKPA